MNPSTWTVVISGVLAAGGIIGTILSRIGKKGDQELQSFSDQFQRMLRENEYLAKSLADERAARAADRTEWETRFTRQTDRCRKITDAATATIIRLLSGRTDPAADATLSQIAEHAEDS